MTNSDISKNITGLVASEPGITLADILARVDGASNVDVFHLIIKRTVYVDLRVAWLGEPERVEVFPDKEAARFYQRLFELQTKNDGDIPNVDDLIPSTTFLLDGTPLEIIHIGKTCITCYRESDKRFPDFPKEQFKQWIEQGKVTDYKIRQRVDRDSEIYKKVCMHGSRDEQAEALWNYENIIKPYLNGEPITDITRTRRTHRNVIVKFNMSKGKCGNGFLGIIPNHHKKGNSTDRLKLRHPELRAKMEQFIIENYETPVYKTKSSVYGAFRNACKAEGINPPSKKVFDEAIKHRADANQTKKIQGQKAAYQQEEFSDWDEEVPIHGDRPWEYAHIDHTVVDVVLRHTDKGVVMGKAWITLLIDSYSRRVLAYYITFDSPSYRSCMGVIRECVRLHGRLPEAIIVDNGSEFHGVYFTTLLARYHCDIIWRPPTKPRFGAIIERFIHTLNTEFIHSLRGNTKIMKLARQVTKEVNPANLAVWNFSMLDEELEKYLYQEYPTRMHRSLGQSPLEAFNYGIARFRPPSVKPIPYDNHFLIDTMPDTKKGTAKLLRSRGIQVRGVFYRSKRLRRVELYGKNLEVRYDPWDRSHIYAWDNKEWIECFAPPRIFALLKNRSEREIKIMSEEDRQLNRIYGQNFNSRVEDVAAKHELREESERLQQQRLKDAELRASAERRGRYLSPTGTDSELTKDVATSHASDNDADDQDLTQRSINECRLEVFKRAKR
jgi:transposase InsO family protein